MEYNFETIENDIVKISIKGRLVAAHSKEFECAATNYLNKSKYVLINLKEMQHIDSYGLMTLVMILQLVVVKNKGILKISHLQSRPKIVFDITKTCRIFDFYETDENALTAFRKEMKLS